MKLVSLNLKVEDNKLEIQFRYFFLFNRTKRTGSKYKSHNKAVTIPTQTNNPVMKVAKKVEVIKTPNPLTRTNVV
ncbi:MAG: hypothetical protein ACJAX0_000815, partial [Flavobacteriales bacterium]